jgi:hypothetical protein
VSNQCKVNAGHASAKLEASNEVDVRLAITGRGRQKAARYPPGHAGRLDETTERLAKYCRAIHELDAVPMRLSQKSVIDHLGEHSERQLREDVRQEGGWRTFVEKCRGR